MVPIYKGKYKFKSVTTAKDMLKYLEKHNFYKPIKPAPKSAILSFARNERKKFLSNFKFKKINGLYSNLFAIKAKESNLVIAGLQAGAARAVLTLETLIAMGIKHLILVGLCGTISDSLSPGDIVVCTKALRDEGVSFHYLKPSKFSYPSISLTSKFESVLQKYNIQYCKGPSWTTDALYRETEAEIKKYKKEGILTVEMEASAIFSVAKYWNVDIAAVFVVSDLLSEEWRPHFHHNDISKNLESLHHLAFETLTNVVSLEKTNIYKQRLHM